MSISNVHTSTIIVIRCINHFICLIFYKVISTNIFFFPTFGLIGTRKNQYQFDLRILIFQCQYCFGGNSIISSCSTCAEINYTFFNKRNNYLLCSLLNLSKILFVNFSVSGKATSLFSHTFSSNENNRQNLLRIRRLFIVLFLIYKMPPSYESGKYSTSPVV